MDIFVKGVATAHYRPELVVSDLTFRAKEHRYEKVLERGVEAVNCFVSDVLFELGETREILKTNGYLVQEKYRLNSSNKRVFDGYDFILNAKVEFGYDISKMGEFIGLVAKLKNPPSYVIGFEVEDEDTYKNQVLSEAVKKAKAKAEAIAAAADMKEVKCLKVDFKPFDEVVKSNSQISDKDFAAGNTGLLPLFSSHTPMMSVAETIKNTFTPEDICISETVYTLWLAE